MTQIDSGNNANPTPSTSVWSPTSPPPGGVSNPSPAGAFTPPSAAGSPGAGSGPAAGWSPTAPAARSSAGNLGKTLLSGIGTRVIGTAIVLALAYGVYWFFVVHKNSDAVKESLPATGKCFSWNSDKGASVLPCTDTAAVYKAEGSSTGSSAQADRACKAAGAYVQFEITSYARNDSQSGVICAALNLKIGDCATEDAVGNSSILPCATAATDDVKVLSIKQVASAADATSDAKASTVCGSKSTQYLSDVSAPAIVCVGKP